MKVQLNDIRARSTWDGKEPENHSPALDYCRKLLKDGVAPETRLDIYRGEQLAYSVTSIGEGAKWAILENKKAGPRFKKYKPFDYSLKAGPALPPTTADAFKS